MDLRPWGYWMRDGQPHEGIADAVATIERVIARITEASGRAASLHSPGGVRRAGEGGSCGGCAACRWCRPPGIWSTCRRTSISASAAMRTRSRATSWRSPPTRTTSRSAGPRACTRWATTRTICTSSGLRRRSTVRARSRSKRRGKTASKVDPEALKPFPMFGAFRVVPYFALTRFGTMGRDAGRTGAAARQRVTGRALSLRARRRVGRQGRSGRGGPGAGGREEALLADKSLDAPLFSPNMARNVFTIAPEMLAGEIAFARKKYNVAIDALRTRRPAGRRAGLHRAGRVALPAAPRAGRGAARGRPSR